MVWINCCLCIQICFFINKKLRPTRIREMKMAENTNKNGLGLAAFIVALIGFLLTLVPLIRVIGAIICGIAFILALIGVFKKPRLLAILGLVLSIAGCIIYYVKWHQLKVALEAAMTNLN